MPGKITFGSLREAWPHEARDFTTWLVENLETLEDRVGIGLCDPEREQPCGAFSVDLVARDVNGDVVVVENQLERTDHDHLGKLITYMAMYEAPTAIWVASEFRPEHVKAVSWLNESTPSNIFLVRVEAIRVDASAWAPLFSVIGRPSAELKAAGKRKREETETDRLNFSFWSELLPRALERTPLHERVSPNEAHWIGTTSGLPRGVKLTYVFLGSESRVELYLDGLDAVYNKAFFDALEVNRGAIEESIGLPMHWDRIDQQRACRISTAFEGGRKSDQSEWHSIQDKLIDAMIKYQEGFAPFWRAAANIAATAQKSAEAASAD